jgi:dsRNA-specific ribonuclease
LFFQEHESEPVNYVGALQETATRNMWPPPKYEEPQGHGKPNRRIFQVTCSLNGASATGYGPKKQAAKQRAAEQLCELLLVEEAVPKKKKIE